MKSDEKEYLKRVGQQLREIRLKKGLTLEQTEEKGITSWRHLQKIEAGKNFTILTLYRIAEAYEINPQDLLKKSGSK